MEFLQLAKERYSMRKFSDRKIEKEKLDLILEAGRISPIFSLNGFLSLTRKKISPN